MKDNFVTVDLPRSGLGHSLKSYSRAYSYYAAGLANFVHPTWFKIRFGPYFRREKDKRNYWMTINSSGDWGVKCCSNTRRIFYDRVTEDEFDPNSEGQYLVVKDDRDFSFSCINPYKSQFVSDLESISRYPISHRQLTPSIGIFHRSGDFKGLAPLDNADEYEKRTHGYGYLPPEYSAEALLKVREIAGWDVPAVLSTDAGAEEVDCIFRLGNISIARSDSAFANMLEMRHHEVLIIGTSSYGRWSYFLGNSFAVYPKTSSINNNDDNPLELDEREGAWFVFKDNTLLNDSLVMENVYERLSNNV